MDLRIVALLAQDGITNGSVYALLALALVLVFAVTRIIWVPSGEFVAFGTLTLAGLQLNRPPGTVGLLLGMTAVAGLMEIYVCVRTGQARCIPRQLAIWVIPPTAIAALAWWLAPQAPPFWAQIALTIALVTALGPLLYRIAYQPLAEASVLVLLIVSVALHFALTGLGLWFFGAEGSRTPAFSSESLQLGDVNVSVQSILVVFTSFALIAALYYFFGQTLYGKALRATALNRVGARRPNWYEGQPEWTQDGALPIERERCVRCRKPLPEGHWRFCSKVCSNGYHMERNNAYAAAERLLARLARQAAGRR
jgi:branched-chain amino acid transport system permease protein